METDASFVYGYLCIIFGLLLALYYVLIGISTPSGKPKNGIPSLKWSQFGWFSFFSLTLMGTIIHFLAPLDIVNFRLWLWGYTGERIVSSEYTMLVDILFIIFCFIRLLAGIRTIRMGTVKPAAGKFLHDLGKASKIEAIALIFGYPLFHIFAIVLFFLGVSILLIGLYIIIIIPIYEYLMRRGIPY